MNESSSKEQRRILAKDWMMTKKPAQHEIESYKALLKKRGLDVSNMTDTHIAKQIAILRGGMVKPTPSDLDRIRANGKKVERLLAKWEKEILAKLKRTLAAFLFLDRRLSSSRSTSKSRLLHSENKAKQVVKLHRFLIAYAPSTMSPRFRNALGRVDQWISEANGYLSKQTRSGEKALSIMTEGLKELIEELQ